MNLFDNMTNPRLTSACCSRTHSMKEKRSLSFSKRDRFTDRNTARVRFLFSSEMRVAISSLEVEVRIVWKQDLHLVY